MRRRDLLTATGASVLAGCVFDPFRVPEERSDRSVFEGQPCQRLLEETTCYHTAAAPPESTDVVLVPEAEELPDDDIDTTFELYNGRDEAYHYATHAFMRRIGGRWQPIPPREPEGNVTAGRLPAGESTTLALERPAVDTYTSYGHEVPLGGGTFSYVVIGSLESGPTRFASAYFRVVGEPLALGIPDRVAIEWDGDAATVRRTDRRPAGREVELRFEVVVRSPDVGTPVSPELASRSWEVGVGLALLQGRRAETVVVHTEPSSGRAPTELLEFAAWDPDFGRVDPSLDYPVLSYRDTAFSVSQRDVFT